MSGKITLYYKTTEKRNSPVEEVEIDEATTRVEQAQALGQIAFDKKTGKVIDVVRSDLEEIVIIEIIEGG